MSDPINIETSLEALLKQYWETQEQLGEHHPQTQHLVMKFRRCLKEYEQWEDEQHQAGRHSQDEGQRELTFPAPVPNHPQPVQTE